MPGLTVDRYGSILVAQVLSLGMEQVKDVVFQALYDELTRLGEHITGIYQRDDVAIRELEGMEQMKGWHPLPNLPTPTETVTEMTENGVRYGVDVENGQKTGFFLVRNTTGHAVKRLHKISMVLDLLTQTRFLRA